MNEDRIAREDRTAALAAFWNARYAGDDYAYGT